MGILGRLSTLVKSNLNDAIDYGRYVLPLVRQELAHRSAAGGRQPVEAVGHVGQVEQVQGRAS